MSATNAGDADTKKDEETSVVTQSFPPSHIIQDGRFIYLPPPNEFERSKFFERSIAKYGLLESDMATSKPKEEEEEEDASKTKKDDAAPKVHPLAIASARLQTGGVAELNRAINLSTLVNTGEYFGLTNIVDPALELGTATVTTTTTSKPSEGDASQKADGAPSKEGSAAAVVPPPATATVPSATSKEMQEEQRVKNAYVLKRKRAVFDKASRVLQRHQARLQAAVSAQTVPDQRLRQLRTQWRLVAPEHGTRAKPHAARPTEVVAIDVDVYDPTGGGSGSSLAGRLASQVPRYATVELTEEYSKTKEETSNSIDTSNNKTKVKLEDTESAKDDDAMDVDEEEPKEKKKKKSDDDDEGMFSRFTIAEPFALADPTMGKTDFDPNKVTCLTLQFDIEKPSTGFCMSSCLEPMTTIFETGKEKKKRKEEEKASNDKKEAAEGVNAKKEVNAEASEEDHNHKLPEDEQVLVSLQHSLFCAKLFEAIRKEIMGEDADEDESAKAKQQKHAANKAATQQSHQSVMWLPSEQEENFLPPPSVMVQPSNSSGAPLCVVHCHASEVKVQLDSEYTLRAKLVEADEERGQSKSSSDTATTATNGNTSGSQTPAQLLVLCRSLLLHSQEAYHKHSLQESLAAAEKQREEEAKKLEADKPRGLDRIQKKDVRKQPKILQCVVGLGTKLLFEQRIRKVLVRVRHWLKTRYPSCSENFRSEWLTLSLFDMHSRFCVCFGNTLTVDVTIIRDEMTLVTRDDSSYSVGEASGSYRKVKFYSDSEFEIFLKLELQRQVKRSQATQQPVAAATAIAVP